VRFVFREGEREYEDVLGGLMDAIELANIPRDCKIVVIQAEDHLEGPKADNDWWSQVEEMHYWRGDEPQLPKVFKDGVEQPPEPYLEIYIKKD